MSHFGVLVIGDDVDEQLAPYHEYECTGIDDEYVVWVPAEETEQDFEDWKKEDSRKKYASDYDSFDQWMVEWHGYRKNEAGEYGRKTNPNAKWDWYVIGGRWNGFLKLKAGANDTDPELSVGDAVMKAASEKYLGHPPDEAGKASQARLCDVDLEGMRQEAKEEAESRHTAWLNAENGKGSDDDKFRVSMYTWGCTKEEVEELKTKTARQVGSEAYEQHPLAVYAVVKNGKWHGKGDMGWFGISNDEFTGKEWGAFVGHLLESVDPETTVTIVDCHI